MTAVKEYGERYAYRGSHWPPRRRLELNQDMFGIIVAIVAVGVVTALCTLIASFA